MSIRKKGLCGLIFVMLLTAMMAMPVSAASAKLNKTKMTIYVGQKKTLKVKNTSKKVKWSSSKKNIATVNSKGVVKGKKAGSAKITAKVGKKKFSCKVTVKENKKSFESYNFDNPNIWGEIEPISNTSGYIIKVHPVLISYDSNGGLVVKWAIRNESNKVFKFKKITAKIVDGENNVIGLGFLSGDKISVPPYTTVYFTSEFGSVCTFKYVVFNSMSGNLKYDFRIGWGF